MRRKGTLAPATSNARELLRTHSALGALAARVALHSGCAGPMMRRMDAWLHRLARRKAGALTRATRVPGMLGWLCIGLIVAAAAPVHAQSGGALESAIGAARERAGADPKAARVQLIQLRSQAVSDDRLDLRLGVDEAECRLLTDMDADEAVKVAQAGVAAARDAALGTARAACASHCCGCGPAAQACCSNRAPLRVATPSWQPSSPSRRPTRPWRRRMRWRCSSAGCTARAAAT